MYHSARLLYISNKEADFEFLRLSCVVLFVIYVLLKVEPLVMHTHVDLEVRRLFATLLLNLRIHNFKMHVIAKIGYILERRSYLI